MSDLATLEKPEGNGCGEDGPEPQGPVHTAPSGRDAEDLRQAVAALVELYSRWLGRPTPRARETLFRWLDRWE